MKYFLLLLTCMISGKTLAQTDSLPIQSVPSLYPTWGASRIQNAADLSASVTIHYVEDTLIISGTVRDDLLVINNDPIHSDHVEIWLAGPGAKSEKFWVIEPVELENRRFSSLVFQTPSANLQSRELLLAGYPIQDSIFQRWEDEYQAIEDPNAPSWAWEQEKVGEHLSYRFSIPAIQALPQLPFFQGTTHFGLLPKGLVRYEAHQQWQAQENTNGFIEQVEPHLPIVWQATEEGYAFSLSLPLSSFRLPAHGSRELGLMVDIVDVDETSKQESVVSTSPTRRWGDPTTFPNLERPDGQRFHALGNTLPPEVSATLPKSWWAIHSTIQVHTKPIREFPFRHLTPVTLQTELIQGDPPQDGTTFIPHWLWVNRSFGCPDGDPIYAALVADTLWMYHQGAYRVVSVAGLAEEDQLVQQVLSSFYWEHANDNHEVVIFPYVTVLERYGHQNTAYEDRVYGISLQKGLYFVLEQFSSMSSGGKLTLLLSSQKVMLTHDIYQWDVLLPLPIDYLDPETGERKQGTISPTDGLLPKQ